MRNNFYNKFKRFVIEKALFDLNDKVLLAVSGGVDSVVMAHLLHRAGYKFAIAHCNFQLRGEESEGDETFVKELARRLESPYFVKRFDTKLYAVEFGISIQMAARDLRYSWFKELLKSNDCKYLATAHHRDDVSETILLNLIKGGVLKGLHGILPKSNHIIRPLLFASKEEITEYASYRKHEYREDKSNSENHYLRNLIRNEIIPLLKQINPDLSDTMYHAAARRHQLENWAETYIEKVKNEVIRLNETGFKASIKDIKDHDIYPEIFFEWVESYGFNYAQVEELFAAFDGTESKLFKGSGYRIIKDREFIVLETALTIEIDSTSIEKGQKSASCGEFNFVINSLHYKDITGFVDSSVAYLDEEKLQFPLLIRKWEHGDSFKPYGLRGRKKISDFLTDLKLDFKEKENQLVICSGDKICWVVGKRIDDHFKVSERTRHLLKIEITALI